MSFKLNSGFCLTFLSRCLHQTICGIPEYPNHQHSYAASLLTLYSERIVAIN